MLSSVARCVFSIGESASRKKAPARLTLLSMDIGEIKRLKPFQNSLSSQSFRPLRRQAQSILQVIAQPHPVLLRQPEWLLVQGMDRFGRLNRRRVPVRDAEICGLSAGPPGD